VTRSRGASLRPAGPPGPRRVDELGAPEVLCLQELRIREGDGPAISALEQALPGYHCHYSLPRDPRNVTFRGGRMYGVATFVQGNWWAEVPEWDREGRVVIVRTHGLAIVNVYAVNGTFDAQSSALPSTFPCYTGNAA
jgi:exodeoxyribonuclease III